MRNSTSELLAILRDNGPASRSDLARAMGVSSAALTKCSAQLLADGLVIEQAISESGQKQLGRPPTRIALVPRGAYAVGAHLGAGRVEIAITDVLLNAVEKMAFEFDAGEPARALVDRVGENINVLIDSNPVPRGRLAGIGVTVPGHIDADRLGHHRVSDPRWSGVPLAAQLQARVGVPAILEHNVTALALAETCYGGQRQSHGTLYVYLGKGIGAGMVPAAHSERANRGCGPVELGHLPLDIKGALCPCGARGCLETVFSEAVLKKLGQGGDGATGIIARAMSDPDWPAHYQPFVQALAITATLLTPDLIVLGGHFSAAPIGFVENLRRDLLAMLPGRFAGGFDIRRSVFTQAAGAMGAAAVGLEHFVYREARAQRPRAVRAAGGRSRKAENFSNGTVRKKHIDKAFDPIWI